MTIGAVCISVLVVWKGHTKIGDEVFGLCRRQERFTKTRKRVSRRVARRGVHVTVRANARDRTLAREELLPVTTQASLMFRILGDIRKRIIALAYLFPVF